MITLGDWTGETISRPVVMTSYGDMLYLPTYLPLS